MAETATITLVEFLTARLAEDEARVDTMPDWCCTDSARGEGWGSRGDCPLCGHYMFDGTETVTEDAMWEHLEIVHQRQRVLREVGAKRAILADHEATYPDPYAPGARDLQHLASVYSDHPDHRSDW